MLASRAPPDADLQSTRTASAGEIVTRAWPLRALALVLLVATAALLARAGASLRGTTGAAALAFGKNDLGQLGDGTTLDRTRPVAIRLPAETLAVAGGGQHSAGLLDGGAILTWGASRDGQLGGLADRALPGPVDGAPAASAIAVGYFHTFGLATDGAVWSWGDDTYGQLGYDSTERCGAVAFCGPRPRRIDGLASVVAVASGFNHGLALDRDGTVWSWGNGVVGQLGDGTRAGRPRPERVRLPGPAATISAGGSQSMALLRDGRVMLWGAIDAERTFVDTPRELAGAPPVAAIAAGEHHGLALARDGSVWSWGDNQLAQLGDDTPLTRAVPAPVAGLSGVVAIAAGTNHNAALTADGAVWTWGWNESGQLGDGTRITRAAPRKVDGIPTARAIGIGPDQVFVLAATRP